MQLKNKRILITGAAFIGIHLIKALKKERVSTIRVVNLSANHKKLINTLFPDVEFVKKDLRSLQNAQTAVKNIDVVFHLAADHGGRGYVDLFQGNTASNLLLDGSIFYAALKAQVEKTFFASSGCVYPNFLQTNTKDILFLKERDVKAPHDADNMYGWAKLMGELTLKAYYRDYGFKSAIGRFFTVYGEYASESHAVMGTIAKAFVEQDPFEVWGDGSQVRNWTYVKDIVHGIIKTVQKIDDASAINLGTNERITVNEMVQKVLIDTKFKPNRIKHIDMPTGPMNRVADITKAKKLLNWQPHFTFDEGLIKTVDWYLKTKNLSQIKKQLEKLLLKS